MIELTDEFLKLKPGTITYWPAELDHPVAGTWSIEIPLEPFSADDEYEPATFRPGTGGPDLVTTAISLDHIVLPASGLAALERRAFAFPANPEEGYIDGSVYLVAAHCPVDVTRIEFGPATADHITATLRARFDFAAAGGIDILDRTADLETTLRFEVGRPVSMGAP
ncbi:hypothetical protein [Actinomadura sp. WMMA1423]|uniref:hypothetical protein n=1 Tax=Actinomadura sp. WMMA1423 TaxID=2591108 RepID=UPI0011464F11|nr:hypothetical protein [Actinomadura sp. WMMA1423]